VTQYRRAASARVADVGGRGVARPKNRRAADKVEAFEKALARVSMALAAAARTSAAELRTQRVGAENPVMSRDLHVLMDEAAEPVSSQPPADCCSG
jgi:hypothetical protein